MMPGNFLSRCLFNLVLFAVLASTACHHGGGTLLCTEGVTCDTGNPCTVGAVVCGAEGTAHCVVMRVEEVPGCPHPPSPMLCVAGTTCDTGDPCLYGEIVCGADDAAHCVVKRVEDVPGCS